MSGEDSWVVFAIAWPDERVRSMDASLALVRQWVTREEIYGLGLGRTERAGIRERALGDGLTKEQAWLVSDLLVADARRLGGPGARVQERARRVTGAVQGTLKASGSTSGPVAGSTGVLGRSAVEGYAVAEHDWQRVDPALVIEDLPWGLVDRQEMRAFPVQWQGVAVDPLMAGGDGAWWREYFWRFGSPRPAWAGDPDARRRVLAVTRVMGWNGLPLRADLDDVEGYLPMITPSQRPEPIAWLVPGVAGTGWTFAWRVMQRPGGRNRMSRARVGARPL